MHNFNRNVRLNLNNREDNDYFLDLIHRFNLNGSHYIIELNHEFDEFIDDGFQFYEYISCKIDRIIDYIRNHKEESELSLILLDRILHMLPRHADCIEITLNNLYHNVHDDITFTKLDKIAMAVNASIQDTKGIKLMRDNLTELKNALQRIVGDYRSNDEYNPFLNEEGEIIFY